MSAEDAFKPKTMKRKNVKGLALGAPAMRVPIVSTPDAQVPGGLLTNNDDSRGDTLEIGVEFRLDLRNEDLQVIKELGAGNGGTVSKVMHSATKVIMARKIIHVEKNKEVRKRIVRELQIMHECNSPYIVSFYGAFMNDMGDVIMCMEYMDVGSLDSISRNFGPVRVDVLGKIAEAVLGGLTYLYRAHRIMHRDIKPSNVLVNSKGQIKLCDFGVSSELDNSVADTFVGTGTYMAPERIQGSPYTVKSDVWSVGLTLMELAIGKFPFHSGSAEGNGPDDEPSGPQGILDLLQQIVGEPSPKLPKSEAFPLILEEVIDKCLAKDPQNRPTPQELFERDPFLQAAKRTPVDLEAWAVSLMERHNRKSHLSFPSISPASKALLRGESEAYNTTITPSREKRRAERANKELAGLAAGPGGDSAASSKVPTPTSGDILITRDSTTSSTNGRSTPASSSSSSRPAFPTRTSSANQVPQHVSHPSSGSARGLDLPIRPAPQVGSMSTRSANRRPDTSGSSGRPDTAGSERSTNSSLEQNYANARRPVTVRAGFSDPRLGSAYSEGRLSSGFSHVSGPRDAYNRSPDPNVEGERRGSSGSGRGFVPPSVPQDPNSRRVYDRF